jgi:hypothetical protein
MEHNKTSGPDDFPTEFYQHFWKIIKSELMALFRSFIMALSLFIVSTLESLLFYQKSGCG